MVVVAAAGPIFVGPDEQRTPSRIAAKGSVLRVPGVDGGWYNVEFEDPQIGLRVGYIEAQYVRR
jgi:hypothetical protein